MRDLEVLRLRRSVRKFLSKAISKVELEKMVDAARFAPTARNVQPWEFVVITDKSKLKQLAALAENARFLDQAAAAIAIYALDTKYYLEDGSAATCSVLLAATALGIGSCWVAGDKKDYCQAVGVLLNVPVEMKLVSLVALGYPQEADAFKEIAKRQLKEVLHWEKF